MPKNFDKTLCIFILKKKHSGLIILVDVQNGN